MRKYNVEGMTCGGCAASVNAVLQEAFPGADIAVDWENGLVTFSEEVSGEAVRKAIEEAGFDFMGEVLEA